MGTRPKPMMNSGLALGLLMYLTSAQASAAQTELRCDECESMAKLLDAEWALSQLSACSSRGSSAAMDPATSTDNPNYAKVANMMDQAQEMERQAIFSDILEASCSAVGTQRAVGRCQEAIDIFEDSIMQHMTATANNQTIECDRHGELATTLALRSRFWLCRDLTKACVEPNGNMMLAVGGSLVLCALCFGFVWRMYSQSIARHHGKK